jgi:hypothetical protein
MNTNQAGYLQAKRHVERKIRFFIHLSVYIIVNAGLILLSQTAESAGRFHALPLLPLLGWGLGLSLHGLRVYLRGPGVRWKERMIEQELRKQQA